MFVMHNRDQAEDLRLRYSGLVDELGRLEELLLSTELNFKDITQESLNHMYTQVERYLRIVNEVISLQSEVKETLSYDDVVLPLLKADVVTSRAMTLMTFPSRGHLDKDIRDTCVELTKKISELSIDLSQDKSVYIAMKAYADSSYSTEKESLSAEKIKAFEDIVRDFKREGLHLPDAQRDEIKRLKKEIEDLSIQFENNLDEDATTFTKTKRELKGVPSSWFTEDNLVDGTTEDENDHVYKISLKYTDYFPIMDQCESSDIRREMYYAFQSRCADTNPEILKQIIIRRQNLSALLGYANYADFCAENRLIGSASKMGEFVESMNEMYNTANKEDIDELTAIARELLDDPHHEINIWDMRYYHRVNTERSLDIDMEEVKQYFPAEKVVNGALSLYEKLFGFKFTLVETDNKWHEKISYYQVNNYNHLSGEMGEEVGGFYLDLYPRDGKYGHAAIFDLGYGCDLSAVGLPGTRAMGYLAMLCNFPETGGFPFDDVVTFLHEFGHIMHSIASSANNELNRHNGFHVATDFVEAPSQMLEHWAYDPRVLEILSSHKDTGDHLPIALSEKLKLSKTINAAIMEKRQLSLSIADYKLHTMSVEELEKLDINTFYADHEAEVTGFPRAEVPTGFLGTFGHLASEYAAGYYGYMFSNVIAADLFDSVFKENPLSIESGRRYRSMLLAPGSSRPELELVEEFLGRPYKIDAYLEDHGLERPHSVCSSTVAMVDPDEVLDDFESERYVSEDSTCVVSEGLTISDTEQRRKLKL